MSNRTRSTGVTSDIGPFAIVPEWLIDTPGLTPSALMVYVALALHADRNTGKAHPSRQTLARRIGVSKPTVDRSLKQLVDIGAIEVQPRYEEGSDSGSARQTTNGYRVLFSNPMGPVMRPPVITGDEGSLVTGEDPPSSPTRSHEPEPMNQNQGEPYDPLRGIRIDGQDLVWNALAAGIDTDESPHGSRMRAAVATIRGVMWSYATATWPPHVCAAALDDPEQYERAVAETVMKAIRWLRDQSPGLTFGPEGVSRHFRRALDGLARARSTQDIVDDVLKGDTDESAG